MLFLVVDSFIAVRVLMFSAFLLLPHKSPLEHTKTSYVTLRITVLRRADGYIYHQMVSWILISNFFDLPLCVIGMSTPLLDI